MEKSREQEIQELFETHENNFCFECGGHSNQWVSMNNGIFLCVACAGIHRGFGIEISYVRSLTMDTWSQVELNMMRKGGNDKLKEFFESREVSMEGHMDQKYRTTYAHHYRDKLKALAEDKPLPTSPLRDADLQMLSEEQDGNRNNGENQEDACSEKVPDSSDAQPTNETTKTPSKINGAKFAKAVQNGFKAFGTSISTGAKNVATGTKNATTKFNEKMKNSNIKESTKNFGNKVAIGVKGAAGKVAVASKEFIHTSGVYAEKGAVAAKKGYVGAVGYFKSLSIKKKSKTQKHEIIDENTNVSNLHEGMYSHEGHTSDSEDQHPSVSL